jgi:hypothetical protein
VSTEEIKRQIQQRVAAQYGEACAEKNQGEIETTAAMVERVRRLEVPAFEPLNPDARQ